MGLFKLIISLICFSLREHMSIHHLLTFVIMLRVITFARASSLMVFSQLIVSSLIVSFHLIASSRLLASFFCLSLAYAPLEESPCALSSQLAEVLVSPPLSLQLSLVPPSLRFSLVLILLQLS